MAKVDASKVTIPFINYQTDIKANEEVIIGSEFILSGQYEQYTGVVEFFDGKKRKISLNKSSATNLFSAFGDDTMDWVGKRIAFTLQDITNPKTKQVIKDARVWTVVK